MAQQAPSPREDFTSKNDLYSADGTAYAETRAVESAANYALDPIRIRNMSETPSGRRVRLIEEDSSDTWKYLLCQAFGIAAVAVNGAAMMMSNLGLLDIAFALPFLAAPYLVSSCRKLSKGRKRRESIFDLKMTTESITEDNKDLSIQIDMLLRELGRSKKQEIKLRKMCLIQEYELEMVLALYQENQRINSKKQGMVEALTFQTLVQTATGKKMKGNHPVGDSELNVISFRLQNIDGVPFTGAQLCERFGRMPVRTISTLVDVVNNLYVEKKREEERLNPELHMKKADKIRQRMTSAQPMSAVEWPINATSPRFMY